MFRVALVLLLVPAVAPAQSPAEKKATLAYIAALRDPETGAFKAEPNGKPGLRACNAAVRAIKYLGGTMTDKDKVAVFVLKCYDPATGGFAEPGGKPDVGVTAVGVMVANELAIPPEKYAKALFYLRDHARSFEEVRIAAAAVEAWGVRDCPFDLAPWFRAADQAYADASQVDPKGGGARQVGSAAALLARLGREPGTKARADMLDWMRKGQRDDGGWSKGADLHSDLDSTYRVMRAFYLLKAPPADPAKLRAFVAACRNPDGGYGVKPGDPSSMGGVYYAATVTHWLDELGTK